MYILWLLRKPVVSLQVNGQDMREHTHEEAASALKNSGVEVTLVVQYRPTEYADFQQRLQQLQDEQDSAPKPMSPPADGPAPVKQLYVRYSIYT